MKHLKHDSSIRNDRTIAPQPTICFSLKPNKFSPSSSCNCRTAPAFLAKSSFTSHTLELFIPFLRSNASWLHLRGKSYNSHLIKSEIQIEDTLRWAVLNMYNTIVMGSQYFSFTKCLQPVVYRLLSWYVDSRSKNLSRKTVRLIRQLR